MSDFKLARLNKWGHFERFTDEDGNQEYPTDTIIDHLNPEEIRAIQKDYNEELFKEINRVKYISDYWDKLQNLT